MQNYILRQNSVRIPKNISNPVPYDFIIKACVVSSAIIFGCLYVFIFDTYYGDSGKFLDLENYSRFFEDVAALGSLYYYDNLGFLTLISSEPGWRLIVLFSSMYFDDPQTFFLTCSVVSITTFSLFVYINSGRLYPLFFLLNPLVVDLVMSQIRSSVAVSVFMIAILVSKLPLRLFFTALAVSIHSSVIVLILIYICSVQLKKISITSISIASNWVVRLFIIISLAMVLSLTLSIWREVLLTAIGDRRAIYQVAVSSALYLVFWFVIGLCLAVTRMPERNARVAWMVNFVAISFLLAFFMSIFGTNGTRFIALSFPFLLVLLTFFPFLKRFLLFGLIFAYQGLQYLYWL